MEILSRLYPYVIALSWIILNIWAVFGMIMFIQYAIKDWKEQWEELQAFLKEHKRLVKNKK